MQSQFGKQPNLFQPMLSYLGVLFRLERGILAMILSYSIAIGLFSLIVPLTVQELVTRLRSPFSRSLLRHSQG